MLDDEIFCPNMAPLFIFPEGKKKPERHSCICLSPCLNEVAAFFRGLSEHDKEHLIVRCI